MKRALAGGPCLALLLTIAGLSALTERAEAVQPPPIFSNYYVGGPPNGGVPAQLYLCPRPTPPYVGHTWITYQPLMPHEFLYHHHRNYYRYYSGGYTQTRVRWH